MTLILTLIKIMADLFPFSAAQHTHHRKAGRLQASI